jgi:hypothetical protein
MSIYDEADFSELKLGSVSARATKVNVTDFMEELRPEDLMCRLVDVFPKVEAGLDFRDAVDAVCAACRDSRTVLVMAGAHVVKTGVSPALLQLCRKGCVQGIAVTGAGLIHDLEIALFGETSELVERELSEGRFGAVRETGEFFCRVVREGRERREGLGECIGRALTEIGAPHAKQSLLATSYELRVPLTVHLAIGTDTINFFPGFDGAIAGDLSFRDFKIFCSIVQKLDRGLCSISVQRSCFQRYS